MNKLLATGLLSILTLLPLFSDEPYVLESYEESIEHMLIDENQEESIVELVPIAETIPMEEIIVEEQVEVLPVESEISETPEDNTPYGKAIKKAKDENKILMIAIRATTCHYCDRMENETLSDQSVLDVLNENFVLYHVDQDKEELPLGLQIGMTPNFVFVTPNEDILDMYPGMRNPSEFLEALEEVLKQPK